MSQIQSILLWETPYQSTVAFMVFNCLYWLLVSWHRRIYSIIALLAFVFTCVKFWCNHIWPEIRLPLSDKDVKKTIKEPVAREISVSQIEWGKLMNSLSTLRTNSPGVFCLATASALTTFALIGKFIPGVVIAYSILIAVTLAPGLGLYVIPISWFEYLNPYDSDLQSKSSTSETENKSPSEQPKGSSSPLDFVLTYFNGGSSGSGSTTNTDDPDSEDYEIVSEADIDEN